MCFPFESIDYLKGLDVGKYGYPSFNHIFYGQLKAKRSRTKQTLFDEFGEYLQRFNMSSLAGLQGFMAKNEVLCLTDDLILTHIRTLQSRHTQFVQLLLQSLA